MADKNKNTNSKTRIIKRRRKKTLLYSLIKWGLLVSIIVILLSVGTLTGLYYFISKDLPKINTLQDYSPSTVTSVYSDDQRKIGEFYNQRRLVIPLTEMSEQLKNAFVAAEDSRFREHPGVDFFSIFRAMIKNLQAGTIVQGGSTITQQVAKSFFLTPARTYERKLKEAILAYRIEKGFSKDEILYLYLNQIYLGHGAYGVEAAAENYFGKHAKELDLSESSMIAGLPQAPSKYSPFRHPKRAQQRQIYVLNRMKEGGFITNLQATEAMNKKLDIKPRKNWFIERVPCYTEYVRRYVEEKYGKDVLYNEGLKVYTAVNIEMQKVGRKQVVAGLKKLDKRQGYRDHIKHVPALKVESFCRQIAEEMEHSSLQKETMYQGVVLAVNENDNHAIVRVGNYQGKIKGESLFWARKPDPEKATWQSIIKHTKQVLKVGDVIWVTPKDKIEDSDLWTFELEQEPDTQAALLCIEAETGHVKTMIGGMDYLESQFNRATQSRRQPGSSFKPIIFAGAIDKGYTAASIIIDSPIIFEDEERDFIWKPKNYHEKFFGPTLLRTALVKSRNIVTIKILKDIGIDYVIDYARKLGIKSDINRDLSIALGSSGTSLLEMVNAYSVFSNLGYLVEPVFITKIVDRHGNILEESELKRKKVIDMTTAYIITHLLEAVVKSGTGWRVKELKRPVAGKTGTTNNLFDAWFLGYTPRYTTGVWVGFDQEKPMGKGETGSRAAAPIWLHYMQDILEGKSVRTFNVPEGVVFAKIDATTGLLPIEESQKVAFECFKEGTVPTEYTPRMDTEVISKDDFFKEEI
ncbi:MAG: PBP1A family penicillin-binding protein [Desulfobacteraceae bacterium]|nr:PBP1A family penicillin-binding protein [Desulfobacteraceae bacterium]